MSAAIGVLGLLFFVGFLALVGYGGFALFKRFQDGPNASSQPLSLQQSISFRAVIVLVIGIAMIAPLGLVSDLVDERQDLYHGVLNNIAASWGESQSMRGPALVIPYIEKHVSVEQVKGDDGKTQTVTKPRLVRRHAVVLPDDLNIQVNIDEEYRNRGIYESLVYTAQLNISGEFSRPNLNDLSEKLHKVDWDRAYLTVGISDTRAIVEAQPLQWNQQPQSWAPGTRLHKLLDKGFHSPLKLDESTASYTFSTKLIVNGSGGFYFAPFGENTSTDIQSKWPHPSFQGAILPSKRELTEQGFKAHWSIPHLARNYPQLWTLEAGSVVSKSFFTTGVQLFQPVFLYSLIERAVKYGLLFIALTFLTFLIFEITLQRSLHFVQYGMIGLALALFYLLLLSLAEHIAFFHAYLLASALAIAMIALYTGAALRDAKRAGLISLLLIGLYALLYSILHMEDYALLMGTGLLLAVVIVLMVVTRNLRHVDTEAK